MMRKFRQRRRRPSSGSPSEERSGRQTIDPAVPPNEREELDTDFDAVEIDDVVRQALTGRINVAELDAF